MLQVQQDMKDQIVAKKFKSITVSPYYGSAFRPFVLAAHAGLNAKFNNMEVDL